MAEAMTYNRVATTWLFSLPSQISPLKSPLSNLPSQISPLKSPTSNHLPGLVGEEEVGAAAEELLGAELLRA